MGALLCRSCPNPLPTYRSSSCIANAGTLSPIAAARETAPVLKGRPGAKEPGGPWDELPALRGIILEALYNQRGRDLVDFETEIGKLPLPDGAMESIVRQLEKKGLVERPFRPLSGLGKGRITVYGVEVVEGTTSPPLSILFQQHIVVRDAQIATGNIQNVSDIKETNTAIDHSQASQDAPKSLFEPISKLLMRILKKFGLNAEGPGGRH